MPNTTHFEFGDIVLVPFPFTDQSTNKKRPAVVISSAEYHRQRFDLILMAVTSQVRPVQSVGDATILHWQAAGLLKQSVLNPLITTVEKGLVLRVMGKLHFEDRLRLRHALNDIIGA
jgi:mRNA interferase MazF